jgi:hypothetical protein
MTDPARAAFVERFAALSWSMTSQLDVAALAAECVELAVREDRKRLLEAEYDDEAEVPISLSYHLDAPIPWAAALPEKEEA